MMLGVGSSKALLMTRRGDESGLERLHRLLIEFAFTVGLAL